MPQSASNQTSPRIALEDGHVSWSVCGDHGRGEPVVSVRGYATSGTQFFENEQLAGHIQRLAGQGVPSLQAEIPRLNGGWAFVARWPTGEVLAAVDRMRSVPLFFYHNRHDLAIATSAEPLAQRFSRPLKLAAQLEFLLFPYITGADTLFDGVAQLQPGELLQFHPAKPAELTRTHYARFYPPRVATDGLEALSDQLAGVLQRMFERIVVSLRGKRAVVPLSGGLDSRLAVGMLKRLGVDDCLCFSYGDEGSEEVGISRQVAEALGYEWRFIGYTPDDWAKWNESPRYREFWHYASKGVSQPHVRDFPAVMQLAADGLCGSDVVYFPGHSADMNAGSHIPQDYPDLLAGRLSPAAHILRGHGRGLWDDPQAVLRIPAARVINDKLAALTTAPQDAAFKNNVDCCEMWNAEQRQSKYIINSVRTYEFVGSPWRTLWDYEFMDFFLAVPVELRYGMKLYLDCLRRKVFVDDLATLGAIPIAGRGPLATLITIRPPARRSSAFTRTIDSLKRRVRTILLKGGVARQRVSKKLERFNTTDVRLSGLGITDTEMTFGQALEQLGIWLSLAPEVRLALQPWLGYQLQSLRFAGVFGTLVLADYAAPVPAPSTINTQP